MKQLQLKSEKQQRAEAKVVYDRFVKLKGELFQKEMVPMSEEDLKAVKKNDWFTRNITAPVFYFFAAGAFIGSVYLIISGDWPIAIGMFLCAIGFVSLSIYLVSYYRELLEQKEKTVFTGIITDKKKYNAKYGTEHFLILSEEQRLVVNEKQYKEFRLGDIVRYETLSLERYINHSINLIGKIGEVLQRDDGTSNP